MLGYGLTAKVLDFVDGRGMRIRHVAALCEQLGVDSAIFVGNSMMGAINLFVDTTSDAPVLPVRAMVTICGGGEIQANEHMAALYDYDATPEAMRRIVTALFADPAYPADDAYVMRRHESATLPGAWEAIAAARFRRPGSPAAGRGAECAPVRPDRRPRARRRGRRGQLLPAGGRPRSPDRSPVRDRPLSKTPGTARNWNRPTSSTPCCWTFSRCAHERRTRRQGRRRHRRRRRTRGAASPNVFSPRGQGRRRRSRRRRTLGGDSCSGPPTSPTSIR